MTLLFAEKQRFRQWWLWLVLLTGSACGPLAILVSTGDVGLGAVWIIVLDVGVIWLVSSLGLDTEVDDREVRIRFRPIHRRWITYGYDSIQNVEAVIYSALKEYGGWGIREGKRGKAYNVSGDKGVLLTLKNGTNVLIGSTDHDVLCSLIQERLLEA